MRGLEWYGIEFDIESIVENTLEVLVFLLLQVKNVDRMELEIVSCITGSFVTK